MAERIIFDKNVFTHAMLNHKLNGWKRTFNDLAEDKDDIHTDAELQARIKDLTRRGNENDGILGQYQYQLETNPKGEFADEFRKYWDFMKYVFMPEFHKEYINNYKLIINKIGIFNEDVQLAILKNLLDKLQDQEQSDLLETISTKIANNKYASTDDMVNSAVALLHKNHDVVRDAVEALKKDLDAELKSEFPTPEKIEHICNNAQNLMIGLQDSFHNNDPHMNNIQNSLSKDYIKTIRNEFDTDKILAIGAEYIPQINKSLEERAVDAERQLHHAQKFAEYEQKYKDKNAEFNRLKMDYDEINRKFGEEKAKNEHLTQQLDVLNKQVEKQNSFIKNIKMKIATLKTGLMAGSGVKDLQQFIRGDGDHQM